MIALGIHLSVHAHPPQQIANVHVGGLAVRTGRHQKILEALDIRVVGEIARVEHPG